MNQLLAGILVAGGISLVPQAIAVDVEIDKPTRTPLSDVPWVPAPPTAQPKVIYGTDDRIDLYQETDPDRRSWAASTCGLFNSSSVQENGDDTFTLRTSSYGVCADEPFATQPTAAFCSGFMVGEDIIATAGHCFDSGNLGSVRFIFGFVMENANTPVLTVPAEQVYTGVELLGRALAGNLDYAVVRVDRAITAVGATPFELRREGVVAVGASVGVIGHPSGLPLKIAFGSNTVVRSNNDSGFFVANLDTYGGNSGSPVVDQATGLLEGILVRGETDFVRDGSCNRSNVVSNTGGRGEDVSKSTSFMQFVPTVGSTVRLDQDAYPCGGTLGVTLNDRDLAGTGTATVTLSTSGGDMEALSVTEEGATGEFAGTLGLVDGEVVIGNGQIEIGPGIIITVAYTDLVHGPDEPDEVIDTAPVDCTAPVLSDVAMGHVGTRAVSINFMADEAVTGRVRYGTSCASPTGQTSFTLASDQNVILQGLLASTTYFYFIEASDSAGNEAVADNGGACFTFTTADTPAYYTEFFPASAPDLINAMVQFTPVESGDGFDMCQSSISSLPVSTSGATALVLSDDGSVLVTLVNGAQFPFFDRVYTQFYINSNGNITFDGGDSTYTPSTSGHFQVPRVSASFSDLDPGAGGQVSYMQLADRMVITWAGVPQIPVGGSNTFQVELLFNGTVRFSYTSLAADAAIVGLSNGFGLQSDFTSTDLSTRDVCGAMAARYHSADRDEDERINLPELLRVIQFLNLDGYHCDVSGEDGYGTGAGDENCTAHDSDYATQDWVINLTEILRLVQFYNVGGYAYEPDSGTEDGFMPVAVP